MPVEVTVVVLNWWWSIYPPYSTFWSYSFLPKLLSAPYSTPRAKFYVHPLSLRREKKGKSQGNKTNKQTKAKKMSKHYKTHIQNHSIYFVLVNLLLLVMMPTLESGCKWQEVSSGANWVSLPQQVSVESNLFRVGLCVYFPFPTLDVCHACLCTVSLGL